MLNKLIVASCLPVFCATVTTAAPYQRGYLSPEESHKSIELQDGYSMKLVLSDPDVIEPVSMAWDGNGVLYVVEMRTYMQDVDAKGEKEPISRISRHEDVDGDGIYEKHSVFIDNLMLPRMVLPLDDRVMVGVTDTLDLWTYRDSDGDGVADEKVKVYEGGRRGGNMEHQPSGLLWNLDNWLYSTYTPKRYRFTDGKFEVEDLPKGQGQWGIGRDNVGRLYYSDAGGEKPAFSFQQPLVYGALNLPNQEEKGFRNVYPIAKVPDVQGGPRRVGKSGGLNHFTGGGGQSIYRGDRLPEDLQGNLVLPEPVGRLIRRAKVTRKDGFSVLSNYYKEDEFVRSADVNFRPLWSATSPDGAMMVIDIHRGIIQQGNWTKKGSYLRGIIKEWGLDKNIGKGRIYRLEHASYRPDKKPQMLKESTAELVAHLSHPNGWWRDTAQKLIILRDDRESVVPALEQLVRSGSSELGRLHGLWTLEGISQSSPEILAAALNDKDSQVRAAAIRIGEPYFSEGNDSFIRAFLSNKHLQNDVEMQLQSLNSIAYSGTQHADLIAYGEKLKKQKRNHVVFGALESMNNDLAERRANEGILRAKNKVFADSMARGQVAFEQLCFACHGADGKGAPMSGVEGQFLAPSFVGNKRLNDSDEASILTLLQGLTGPLDGKKYVGLMVGMENNSDEWIADIVTYIRNSFGNESYRTDPEMVAYLRKAHRNRKTPWTQGELEKLAPPTLFRKGWKLTASHGEHELKNLTDDNPRTRYTTGAQQKKGMWVQVELPRQELISGIKMDNARSNRDYPRGYQVVVSKDGKNWSKPLVNGVGGVEKAEARFVPQEAKFIKVELTADCDEKLFWTIHELELYGVSRVN